jgi:RNA polymerase sigma factor (TIGR02999 family)
MSEVTRLLQAIEQGDSQATDELLPLVYDELRKLAAQKLSHEKPGQTLQATGLVHEAYLRLVGGGADQKWSGHGHFFAAAAEAMRRILIEQARRKASMKHGGQRQRVEMSQIEPAIAGPDLDLIALDAALEQFEKHDRRAAALVKLRFFTGLTMNEAADVLGVSLATAENDWAYAKSWLRLQIFDSDNRSS